LKNVTRLILFTVLLFSLWNKGFSQFVVHDTPASDPQTSIFDPEYNMHSNLICWKSDENDLWVSGINPTTHLFEPYNGKGSFVTGNLAPNGDESWNGPEWMLSSQSTQIVYIKAIQGIRYTGVATKVIGGWMPMTLFDYHDAVYSMATTDVTDTVARFLFETKDHDGIYWVKNSCLFQKYFYPDITLGFFARDDQQICCATDKSLHPGFLEVEGTLPYFTCISQDTIGAPFMWLDPATGTRMFLYRTNGNHTLKIFQELAPNFWVLYNEFNSPLPEPFSYITSPEPFTCGGKSYVSFMAAQSGSGKDGLPAEIWLASADPSDQFMRRVSDSTLAVRTDPEPVVFSDSAYIYYTYVRPDEFATLKFNIRKCETGLSNLMITSTRQEAAVRNFTISPNPNRGTFSLDPTLTLNPESVLEVYDISGKQISATPLGYKRQQDFSHLPPGTYRLRIRDPHQVSACTMVISH
jgi:hypothetical protein